MKTATRSLLLAALSWVAWSAAAGLEVPETKVLLNLELLLVDSAGAHPMTTEELEVGTGGAFHQIFRLEDDGESVLVFRLGYRPLPGGELALDLDRDLVRGGREEKLPPLDRKLAITESWTTTLLDDAAGLEGRLELRVVPMLRRKHFDEPIDEWRPGMQIVGGPLVHYGDGPEDDRVIFRQVNLESTYGAHLGVRGVGTIRFSYRKFPGAEPCGWARGHTYRLAFGEHSFGGWSARPILPNDPLRPDRGWTLYGILEPDASLEYLDGFYGAFDPDEPIRR